MRQIMAILTRIIARYVRKQKFLIPFILRKNAALLIDFKELFMRKGYFLVEKP